MPNWGHNYIVHRILTIFLRHVLLLLGRCLCKALSKLHQRFSLYTDGATLFGRTFRRSRLEMHFNLRGTYLQLNLPCLAACGHQTDYIRLLVPRHRYIQTICIHTAFQQLHLLCFRGHVHEALFGLHYLGYFAIHAALCVTVFGTMRASRLTILIFTHQLGASGSPTSLLGSLIWLSANVPHPLHGQASIVQFVANDIAVGREQRTVNLSSPAQSSATLTHLALPHLMRLCINIGFSIELATCIRDFRSNTNMAIYVRSLCNTICNLDNNEYKTVAT